MLDRVGPAAIAIVLAVLIFPAGAYAPDFGKLIDIGCNIFEPYQPKSCSKPTKGAGKKDLKEFNDQYATKVDKEAEKRLNKVEKQEEKVEKKIGTFSEEVQATRELLGRPENRPRGRNLPLVTRVENFADATPLPSIRIASFPLTGADGARDPTYLLTASGTIINYSPSAALYECRLVASAGDGAGSFTAGRTFATLPAGTAGSFTVNGLTKAPADSVPALGCFALGDSVELADTALTVEAVKPR